MQPRQLTVIAVGLAVLVLGAIIVRDGTVPAWEESAFHAVNDLPPWLYGVLWPVQQLGVLVVGPILAMVCVAVRRYRLAIAVLLATLAKLVAERIVKAVVSRERPFTSIGPDISTRGEVSLVGESFVSGHAVLAAALAGVTTPYLPSRWRPVPWVLVALVMFGRVYVGAHNPLDVVCGAALGVVLAGGINLLTGAPSAWKVSTSRAAAA